MFLFAAAYMLLLFHKLDLGKCFIYGEYICNNFKGQIYDYVMIEYYTSENVLKYEKGEHSLQNIVRMQRRHILGTQNTDCHI